MTRVFKSANYDPQGEFLMSLSADDYTIIAHALVLAGTVVEESKGTDAALPYDDLHDRLMGWNHNDLEPAVAAMPDDVDGPWVAADFLLGEDIARAEANGRGERI